MWRSGLLRMISQEICRLKTLRFLNLEQWFKHKLIKWNLSYKPLLFGYFWIFSIGLLYWIWENCKSNILEVFIVLDIYYKFVNWLWMLQPFSKCTVCLAHRCQLQWLSEIIERLHKFVRPKNLLKSVSKALK